MCCVGHLSIPNNVIHLKALAQTVTEIDADTSVLKTPMSSTRRPTYIRVSLLFVWVAVHEDTINLTTVYWYPYQNERPT